MLHGSQNVTETHPQCLFSTDGHLWTDEKLRKVFFRVCTRNGLSIGIQDYRQAVTTFLRRDGVQRSSLMLQTFLHEQAGHGSETAELQYGTTNLDPMTIGPDTLVNFFRVSQCWHSLIGLDANTIKTKSSEPNRRSNQVEHIQSLQASLESSMSNMELLQQTQMEVVKELRVMLSNMNHSPPGNLSSFTSQIESSLIKLYVVSFVFGLSLEN